MQYIRVPGFIRNGWQVVVCQENQAKMKLWCEQTLIVALIWGRTELNGVRETVKWSELLVFRCICSRAILQLSIGATGNQLLSLDKQLALLAQYVFFLTVIHWIAIYPLDNIIRLMNNWVLIVNSLLQLLHFFLSLSYENLV